MTGEPVEYDDNWVERHMRPLRVLFNAGDVKAITIHREDGDHRYELIEA